jgi:hypothetical protein
VWTDLALTLHLLAEFWPNKGLELTASSVHSYLAPASGSSSGLAFGSRYLLCSQEILTVLANFRENREK